MSGRHGPVAVIGLFVGLSLCFSPADGQQANQVYRVPIQGDIELGLAPFVERSLGIAQANGAAAVILAMRSNGTQ